MQNQIQTPHNAKRLGPPPPQPTQGSNQGCRDVPRKGISKGEIALAVGITAGFVLLGVFLNLFKH
ncbi:MAG: hypothetical protein H7145_09745 [Akkermansiaceae bacterium]|nr:hypothetical protein [Armatimonadota bacterium]